MRKKSTEPRKQDAADKESSYSAQDWLEKLCEIVSDYAYYVEAPRIFAQKRRSAGDPSASPRDYDCDCYVDADDFIPLCAGRQRNCKFANHPDPQPNFVKNEATHDIRQARVRGLIARLENGEHDGLVERTLHMPEEIRKVKWRRWKLAHDRAPLKK
ncbi:MAG: hypothetical protein R3C51_11380 [Parvularculaceae bacterium]